ncbi:MAG: transcription-repair coupling factor [Bryobacterales bacterium]|nr:transcription-repair coupling factor [Bryobacterales bacterium]
MKLPVTHPSVRDLFQTLGRDEAFQHLVSSILRHDSGPFSLAGLTPTAKALYAVLLWQVTERPLIVIADNQRAEVLAELTGTFFDLLIGRPEVGRPALLPALDVLPGQRLSPHTEISEQRAIGLWRMAAGSAPITVTPAASALLRTHDPEYYRRLALAIRTGEELPLDTIESHLRSIGYERRDPVEMVGEYSIRGGILDVFGAESARPVRIEFFGDEVESIRRFDVETQRSILKVPDAEILPLLEQPRRGDVFPGWEFASAAEEPRKHSLLALGREPVVILDEPEDIRSASERLWKRLDQLKAEHPETADLASANFFDWPEFEKSLTGPVVNLRELHLGADTPHIASRPSLAFQGNMQVAVAEAKNLVERGNRVAFFAPSNGELERLADVLREYSVPFQLGLAPNEAASPYLAERSYLAGPVASTYLVKGLVRRGAVFPESQIAFIGSEDLFGSSEMVAQPGPSKSQMAAFAADLADLKPGDFVVHTTHGVGKFLGIREIVQGEQKGDFMLLEYSSEAKLYVPLTRMDLVEKYRGGGDSPPPLDRLGGSTWTAKKSRVKAKMRDMADELLKLYAERRMAEGIALSPDSNWQREFEDAFEFTETKDQLTATKEIKRDLESPHPMDRLLCGDVGFGKTEVAMRATFKALGDGKQVAVLAPTTVLAFQHFETFKRRFAAFPVRIEMFSRLRPAKELKKSIEELADGRIDIAIGTHRLFSQDVKFRDLGLLVVDEEQRFGVRHKERLKQMRKNVHVLAMSATPIPRTLHMSLLGIRDMSVIETPPKDRLAIHTVVAHFNPELVRTAIEQELSRGGQVYFVHNRIDSIFTRAAWIQELVPQARIGVGHGQMSEAELERVLLGFMRHEYDVFVSTTIVENGLDIPLANTMIIDHAERHGLSELYQLRGRVGRSNRRAYAYLLVPGDTELSEIARKRLAALREFSDLGAGFKIAALDLELRGAGNLLGGEQHGHIAAVGFDTYVRLLEETVRELKGEEAPLEVHSALNLGLDIRIPPDYIADEQQRLRAYKRIADVRDAEQAEAMRADLGDRYGPLPDAVETLLRFALLKSNAQQIGIEAVDRRGGALNIKFHPGSKIEPARLMTLVSSRPGAQFTPAGVLRLPLPQSGDGAAALLDYLDGSLKDLVRT